LNFFGRVAWPKDSLNLESINKFNEAIKFWEREIATEIAVICAKLNFTKTEVKQMTLPERKLYLEIVSELFGKKEQQPQRPHNTDEERFPLSHTDKKRVEANTNKFKGGDPRKGNK